MLFGIAGWLVGHWNGPEPRLAFCAGAPVEGFVLEPAVSEHESSELTPLGGAFAFVQAFLSGWPLETIRSLRSDCFGRQLLFSQTAFVLNKTNKNPTVEPSCPPPLKLATEVCHLGPRVSLFLRHQGKLQFHRQNSLPDAERAEHAPPPPRSWPMARTTHLGRIQLHPGGVSICA